MASRTSAYLKKRRSFGANHYPPNEIAVFGRAQDVWVKDVEGRVYMDAIAGYSAANLGHNPPEIVDFIRKYFAPDKEGWGPINIVPNSFLTAAQADFLERVCGLTGFDRALATNTGAEAVETAIKLARKWGYAKKGIPNGRAVIVAFDGNFHGRTTTIVSFSSERKYCEPFAPHTPGFAVFPFGETHALEWYLAKNGGNVAAILFEPIQGEGGIRIPPKGFVKRLRELATEHRIMLIADEIQTGLGRTGRMLACQHEEIVPDVVLLGKSLGAGITPVAAVLAKDEFMCFEPGEHGSTYGGNPFAMSLAFRVLSFINDHCIPTLASRTGSAFLGDLKRKLLRGPAREHIKEIRGRGLMIGIELMPGLKGDVVVDTLLRHGVLTKDAHGVVRITPPLTISPEECREMADRIAEAFASLARAVPKPRSPRPKLKTCKRRAAMGANRTAKRL